jgi:cytochrome c
MNKFKLLSCCVAWTVASAPMLFSAGKGDAAKGKEVFEQCGVCHNADSTEKKMGPGLKGLFSHDKMLNGKKPTEANVRAKVDEGGNGMPAYKEILSDEDKDNVIAYLKTL